MDKLESLSIQRIIFLQIRSNNPKKRSIFVKIDKTKAFSYQ